MLQIGDNRKEKEKKYKTDSNCGTEQSWPSSGSIYLFIDVLRKVTRTLGSRCSEFASRCRRASDCTPVRSTYMSSPRGYKLSAEGGRICAATQTSRPVMRCGRHQVRSVLLITFVLAPDLASGREAVTRLNPRARCGVASVFRTT
jgi:hypothetical protein